MMKKNLKIGLLNSGGYTKLLVNFQNKLNNVGISFKIYADNEVQCIKKLIKSENIDNILLQYNC